MIMENKLQSIGIRCPEYVYHSKAMQHIRSVLSKRGKEVFFYDSNKAHKKVDYFSPLYQHEHVIVWRYFHSNHQNYTLGNNNVLFIDKSVVDPENSLFVDSLGFGGFSSVVVKKQNVQDVNNSKQVNVNKYLNDKYGLYVGNNKNGHILVSLFMDLNAIHACHEMLPDNKEVFFTYPPSMKNKYIQSINMYIKKHDNWKILDQNADIYDYIIKSRAIVTNLDNIAFLGLVRGIPTATLGRGLWSGTSCTLDCTKNPRLLKTILAFEFDHAATDKYLSAVYSKNLDLNCDFSYIENNIDIKSWFSKIK